MVLKQPPRQHSQHNRYAGPSGSSCYAAVAARVARDGLPERAWRAAGAGRREQETLGDAGDYQDTTASTRGRDDRHADDDLTKGPPAAGRRAATDRDGGVRRGRPVSECTGHAEATREPTETSGVAETRGVEAAVLWTPLRAAHRTWNTGRPVFHKLPHPSLSRFCATELDGHNPGKRTFLLWRKADISTLVRQILVVTFG